MRMREFIRQNRADIDYLIRRLTKDAHRTINDEDRRQWVLNDEALYSWARRQGVKI